MEPFPRQGTPRFEPGAARATSFMGSKLQSRISPRALEGEGQGLPGRAPAPQLLLQTLRLQARAPGPHPSPRYAVTLTYSHSDVYPLRSVKYNVSAIISLRQPLLTMENEQQGRKDALTKAEAAPLSLAVLVCLWVSVQE